VNAVTKHQVPQTEQPASPERPCNMELVGRLLRDVGHSLLQLLSDGTLSDRRLPGHWVSRSLADEALSGWATATVAKQCLSPPVAGTLESHSLTRVFTRATAVPTVKLRLSRLRWEVQAWRTQWPV
jgi:hypothetical protein